MSPEKRRKRAKAKVKETNRIKNPKHSIKTKNRQNRNKFIGK